MKIQVSANRGSPGILDKIGPVFQTIRQSFLNIEGYSQRNVFSCFQLSGLLSPTSSNKLNTPSAR